MELRERIIYAAESWSGCVELQQLYVETYAISDRYRSEVWKAVNKLKKEGKVVLRRIGGRLHVCLPR